MHQIKKIKICGITNEEDARQAVEAGATHIGLIFVESSPRRAAVQKARIIVEVLDKKASAVGVFQNQPLKQVLQISQAAGLDTLQLHGEESIEYCTELSSSLAKPIIKTIVIEGSETVERLQRKIDSYRTVNSLLFDRAKGDKNETWLENAIKIVAAIEKQNKGNMPPYFFAGGLTASNVRTVLKSIKPSGVDIASGVEAAPGKKDPALVRAFIQSVKGRAEEQT